MLASVSSGREPVDSSMRSRIADWRALSDSWTATSSRAPAPACGAAAIEFGRTVMIETGVVTFALTDMPPAKIDWVTDPSASTSTASVSRPLPVFSARRPATSLPSELEASSTATGDFSATSCASNSALGATEYSATSSLSAT